MAFLLDFALFSDNGGRVREAGDLLAAFPTRAEAEQALISAISSARSPGCALQVMASLHTCPDDWRLDDSAPDDFPLVWRSDLILAPSE